MSTPSASAGTMNTEHPSYGCTSAPSGPRRAGCRRRRHRSSTTVAVDDPLVTLLRPWCVSSSGQSPRPASARSSQSPTESHPDERVEVRPISGGRLRRGALAGGRRAAHAKWTERTPTGFSTPATRPESYQGVHRVHEEQLHEHVDTAATAVTEPVRWEMAVPAAELPERMSSTPSTNGPPASAVAASESVNDIVAHARPRTSTPTGEGIKYAP